MANIWMDVDTALSEVPVNATPLIDDTDFKTREESVVYNQAGMDLVWNFVTTAGAYTQTAVTPTTAGVHDWSNQGNGMYAIEIPASAGTINNDTEGYGWFTGYATGILPWTGPIIGFRAAVLNNAMVDGGDLLDVNVTHIADTAQTAFDVGAASKHIQYAGPLGVGIYYDDAAANTNTVFGTDGTYGNPVSSYAAANTLAGSLGVNRIYITGGSTLALTGLTLTDYEIIGIGSKDSNILNLGTAASPSALTRFRAENLAVYGTHDHTDRIKLERCMIDDAPAAEITSLRCHAKYVTFLGDFSLDTSSDNIFDFWSSGVAGNGYAVCNATGSAGTVVFRHGSGGIGLNSLSASHNVSVETDGQVVFESGCNVNAAVTIRGNCTKVDNTAGMVNLTEDARIDTAQINAQADQALVDMFTNSAQLVDDIWDEPIAGHLTAGTAGLSEALGSAALVDTTATGTPTSTTIQLTAGSSIDDFYNDQLLYILSGTGAGQVRPILDYVGATKTITVDEAFITTPAAADRVAVLVSHVHPIQQIQSGLATEAKQDTAQADLDIITGADGVNLLSATQASIDAIETDTSTTIPNQITALNDPTAAAIAAAVASYNMGNGRTIAEALAFLRNKWDISGGTLTVYDTDDTTVLWTAPVTQTAGDPVSGIDPV